MGGKGRICPLLGNGSALVMNCLGNAVLAGDRLGCRLALEANEWVIRVPATPDALFRRLVEAEGPW